MAFTTAKFTAAVANIALKTIFLTADEVKGIGNFCGIFNLIPCNVKLPQGNIIGNGIIKQNWLLGNDAHLVAEGMKAVFFNIHAVNQKLTACYIVKAGYKVGKGTFAGAAAAYQRNGLPFFDSKVYIL